MRNICVSLTLMLAVGCGGAKKDEDTADDTTTDGTGTGQVGVLALANLNLDKSIDPTIPSSVIDSTGASLRGASLTDSDKSLERCLLQQSISEFKSNVASVKMQLCSLTTMAGLEWGKAYNISMAGMAGGGGGTPPGGGGTPPGGPGGELPPGGPGGDMPPGGPGLRLTQGTPGGMPDSLQVKMDNSVEGEYTIYVCADKVLQQKIRVSSASDTGAAGSYAVKMDMGNDNVMEMRGSFDNGVTTAGHYVGTTQMRFALGAMKMNSSISLDLDSAETGVQFVQSSREQATSFADVASSTKELMAGRFGSDFGSAIVQRSGGNDSIFGPPMPLTDEATPETARAFFNVDGGKVEETASPAFAEGGAYYMTDGDLPLLADPTETWALEGWDCATGVEEFTPPEQNATTVNACFEESPFSSMQFSCFGPGFAPGMQMEGVENRTGKRDDNKDIFANPPPPPPPPGGEGETPAAP